MQAFHSILPHVNESLYYIRQAFYVAAIIIHLSNIDILILCALYFALMLKIVTAMSYAVLSIIKMKKKYTIIGSFDLLHCSNIGQYKLADLQLCK